MVPTILQNLRVEFPCDAERAPARRSVEKVWRYQESRPVVILNEFSLALLAQILSCALDRVPHVCPLKVKSVVDEPF
jgi:hypothetical protein